MGKLTISTSTTSQNIANNYSNVKVTLVLDTTENPYSYNYESCSGCVKIDGTKYSFSSKWNKASKTTIYSSTKAIYHNANGSKSLSISASFSTNTSAVGTVTASNTVTLKTIPRNSILNKLTNSRGNWEFNIGTDFGVNITKYASSYTDTLTFKTSDGTTVKTISGISNGDTVSFTSSEIDTMYQKTTTSNVCNLTYTFTTKSGSTTIGSTTGTIKGYINVVPTINSISITPDNNTKALTGATNKFIDGYSSATITLSATGNSYATIDHFSVNGAIYQATSGSTTLTLTNISSSNLNVYAIDSRGNQTSQTQTLTLIGYTQLTKGTQSYSRTNNVEEETTISFNGSFWNKSFGSISNSINASYRFKNTESSTWTIGTTSITPTYDSSGNFQFSGAIKGDTSVGFDIDNSYDLEVTISDKTLTEITFTYLINSGTPAIAVYKNKIAIGGRYDETKDGTQINNLLIADKNAVLNDSTKTGTEYDTTLGGTQVNGSFYLNGKDPFAIKANKVLWGEDGDCYYMSANHTITLSEKVSEQETGIVLHWQAYVSGLKNYDHVYRFIPKQHVVNNNSAGIITNMATVTWATVGAKYVYVYDTKIEGNDYNTSSGTGSSGIKYNNKHWVLSGVIGV